MSNATVKPAKRRRGTPISFWVTEREHALLQERAAELQVDKSTLLRAGIWNILLDQATAKQIPSTDAATFLYRCGSRLNSWKRLTGSATSLECPALTLSAPPSNTSFSMTPSGEHVTHCSERLLSDVGGWHTSHHGILCKSNQPLTLELNGRVLALRRELLHHPRVWLLETPSAPVQRPRRLPTCLPGTDGIHGLKVRGGEILVDAHDVWLLCDYGWHARGSGYTYYAIGPNDCRLHRVILDAPEGVQVDHINGDGLDNRRCNLRLATPEEQMQNRRKFANNTSGFRGVSPENGRWRAQIKVGSKARFIGLFDTPEEAARAFDAEAVKTRGSFARLNFPESYNKIASSGPITTSPIGGQAVAHSN